MKVNEYEGVKGVSISASYDVKEGVTRYDNHW
jgi:hypothetical protein